MSARTFAAVCLALALAARAVPAAAQTRLPIGFISLQKILTDSADAKEATKELDALRNAKAVELNAKKKELDASKVELANASGFFGTVKRTQLQGKIRQQEAELQQATLQAQSEFQERQRKLQESLRAEINTIVTALATERGIQYVLNEDTAVVLAPRGADLTPEVLERLNAASAKRAAEKK